MRYIPIHSNISLTFPSHLNELINNQRIVSKLLFYPLRLSQVPVRNRTRYQTYLHKGEKKKI